MPNLVYCRCCQKEISNEAPACIHCGQPDPSVIPLQVVALIRLGQKRKAIQMLRQRSPELNVQTATNLVEREEALLKSD